MSLLGGLVETRTETQAPSHATLETWFIRHAWRITIFGSFAIWALVVGIYLAI